MPGHLTLPGSFMYEHTDIPEGMTLDEYRVRRAAKRRRRRHFCVRAALNRWIGRARRPVGRRTSSPSPVADPPRLGPAG